MITLKTYFSWIPTGTTSSVEDFPLQDKLWWINIVKYVTHLVGGVSEAVLTGGGLFCVVADTSLLLVRWCRNECTSDWYDLDNLDTSSTS